MIEFFDLGNRSVVFGRDLTQIVSFAHPVILRRTRGFRFHCLLWLTGSGVRHGDRVTRHKHGVVFQGVILEIDETIGVDVITKIAHLEMEVGTVGTSRVAAETDDVASFDYLSWVHEAAGEVTIVGFKPIVVADNHEIAIASGIGCTFGNAHNAVPCCGDRRAFGIAEIDTPVHSTVTEPIVGSDAVVRRMMVTCKVNSVARR